MKQEGQVCHQCGEAGLEDHPCPFQQDINDDCETQCNCCENCAAECAADI